jgi:hypothetical protein
MSSKDRMVSDGRLAIDEAGQDVCYEIYGPGSATLLGLHGGAGLGHRPIARHGEVADENLQLVLGNSSQLTILEKEGDAYLAVVRSFIDRMSAGGKQRRK